MVILLALAVAAALSGLLSWKLAQARGGWQALDIPNERSLHTRPTPRTGGLAILLGTAAGMLTLLLLQGRQVAAMPLYLAVLALALISLTDDRYHLRAGTRLLAQIAIAGFLLYVHHLPDTPAVLLPAAILFLVWMTNLYNFMDGMDGFAGGMSIFGFGTYALLGWQAGNVELALGCATVAAACTGFLLFNFPPAKLFMGDVGSTVLGLLAGIVILQAHRAGTLPVWLGILVFSPFIVDASVTLLIRILHRERFWEPHKKHYYQRVVQSGWGHRRTVLAEYVLMLACCGSALAGAALSLTAQLYILAVWALFYAALAIFVHRFTIRIPAGA